MAAASIFVLIFLSTITLSLASVNIDCGTSTSGVDNNNIKWVGDKDFVTSGESSTISTILDEKSLNTLRYFPTGESNCYSNIPVTKGGKVLLRTMFYYGNYDGKSSPPTFNVIFDGKHQDTVLISSATVPYMWELIFVPVSAETSVCFVRTSSSNPFVSSIEVVDMASGMYDELAPDEAFFYNARLAYGATTGFLRMHDRIFKKFLVVRSDIHGRFWLSSGPSTEYTVMQSSATSIDTSEASNKPPETVLQNSWSGDNLVLQDSSLPSGGVPVYLAMYFSDPIDTFGSRSFDIFLGGKQVNKSPVVPMFGKTIQVVVRDVVVSSTTQLEFRSTAGSIFPPLINALELYVISKGTGSGSGGGGGSGGGSGSSGAGGTGRSNEVSSGESTKEEKNNKLPIILGAVSAAAFVLIAYVSIAIILTNRRRARLQALAMPTSTAAKMGTAAFPLFGQQMGHDSNQPANEAGMGEPA